MLGVRPNIALQRTRSAPLREPLSFGTLGRGAAHVILGLGMALLPAVLVSQSSARAKQCVGLEANLTAVDPVVKVGVPLRLRLTLRNPTAQAVRVLDIRNGRRPDLEETYFRLEILRKGKTLDIPHAICDPGPISDRDFFKIAAGAAVTVSLSGQCIDLRSLKPGRYTARLLVWKDPLAGPESRCLSTEALFEVHK